MSVKSDKVKSGYAELSEAEKAEVKSFIKDYDNAGPLRRVSLSEGATRTFNKSLGPISENKCPCCGNR